MNEMLIGRRFVSGWSLRCFTVDCGEATSEDLLYRDLKVSFEHLHVLAGNTEQIIIYYYSINIYYINQHVT